VVGNAQGSEAVVKFYALLAAVLALMAGLLIHTSRQEAQTFDEATHIAAGYSYWMTGDHKINVEHPPLAKLIATLPLLAMGLRFETTNPHWVQPNQTELGRDFLYNNARDADSILLAARAPTMLLTLMLGAAIAWWTRRRFGSLAAAAALLLYTDVPVTFFGFLAAITWFAWLESGRKRDLAAATLALGFSAATKFSGLYLLPVHAALLLVQVVRRRRSWRSAAGGFLIAVLGAGLICSLTYGREFKEWRRQVRRLRWEAPRHPYWHGLKALEEHNRDGHRSYLLGEVSQQGRWNYFPVAFLVKTPAVSLVLTLAAIIVVPILRRRRNAFAVCTLLAYPLAYFALSAAGNINIGVRHLLPMYPFLFILAGILAASLPKRAAATMLAITVVSMAAEAARTYPHHLAFFNAFVGGPANGHKYLLDSNLDWGQDVKKLKRYMDEHGITFVQVAYFGMADFAYYGIPHGGLPGANEREAIDKLDNWVAASVTNVYDVYFDRETFGWLRHYQPVAKIGWSLYLYDLRQSTLPAGKRPLPAIAP
jgi:hypothetical protein